MPEYLNREEFGERLKRVVQQTGLQKKQFAARIGASPSQIFDWGRGRVTPSAYYICAICREFGVSADYLLGLKGGTERGKR